MAADESSSSSLEETPTFAAAMVCFVLVFVSIVIDHIIHLIGQYLKDRNKIKLYEALQKIKSELMIVGFISLIMTATKTSISKIRINRAAAESWLPCKEDHHTSSTTTVEEKVPFISEEALHELHVFIFALACVHVIICVLTMVMGKAKMKNWCKWEEETKTEEYMSSHNSRTPRYTRQITFVRRHFNFWTTNPFLRPIRCFFKQFFKSVRKADYLTLRHGFITAHVAPENQGNFDFHNYMDKSLEEDFKVVVGISPLIWFTAVISILFNKYNFHHSLWLPTIPLIVLLVVGTKLQVIIAKMALRIQETSTDILVVGNYPIVQLRDDLFWFNSPRFLLHLINFVIFQTAFQATFYGYTWWKFDIDSCFHKGKEDSITIMCMALLGLILCSYVTLPLFALVTLMGSTMKPTESSRHMREGNRRASSTIRPDPKHLDATDQAFRDSNDSHESGMAELAIQIPRA